MLKRALITLGATAVVVTAGAGVANAQGTNVSPLLPASNSSASSTPTSGPDAHTRYNHPDVDPAKAAPAPCEHGQVRVGATCEEPWLGSLGADTAGAASVFGMAGIGAVALVALAIG